MIFKLLDWIEGVGEEGKRWELVKYGICWIWVFLGFLGRDV